MKDVETILREELERELAELGQTGDELRARAAEASRQLAESLSQGDPQTAAFARQRLRSILVEAGLEAASAWEHAAIVVLRVLSRVLITVA